MLPSAPGSGRRGQRWSEVKVQDVSHRTGQGVGHTLVEVTKKHKDMAAGRGRRSRSHNKKNEEMEGEEEGVSNRGGCCKGLKRQGRIWGEMEVHGTERR